MRRALAVLAGLGVTTIVGCKVGPRYKPEPVIPPDERIGTRLASDSTRRFFDSLAVERTRDSVPVVPPNAPRASPDPGTGRRRVYGRAALQSGDRHRSTAANRCAASERLISTLL